MIKVIPYKKELLDGFLYDGIESETSGKNITAIVDYLARQGKAYVGMIDDKVIGIGGVYPLWEGSGSCYLFLNKEAKNHKVRIFKILIKYIKELVDYYSIKTMMVECQNYLPEAHNLLKHLGFNKGKIVKMSFYSKEN